MNPPSKPFFIDNHQVYEAYLEVRSKESAGGDAVGIRAAGRAQRRGLITAVPLKYVLCQIKSYNAYGRKISSNSAHERRSTGQGFEDGHLGTPRRYGGDRDERHPPSSREPEGAGQAIWRQSEDGRQM
jgi:hypothetical protein